VHTLCSYTVLIHLCPYTCAHTLVPVFRSQGPGIARYTVDGDCRCLRWWRFDAVHALRAKVRAKQHQAAHRGLPRTGPWYGHRPLAGEQCPTWQNAAPALGTAGQLADRPGFPIPIPNPLLRLTFASALPSCTHRVVCLYGPPITTAAARAGARAALARACTTRGWPGGLLIA
jgi:hypothetical protein